MFLAVKFKTSVQLAPTDLHDDFDIVILSKLQRTLEGVCSKYGYIKRGSLEIVKRSAGKLMKQHFNGYIYFTVICKAKVCNPSKDMVVQAKVVLKNALGILAESYIDDSDIPVLDIIVPKKTAGIVSEIDVDDVNIGETVYITVIGKRFQLNDPKISIIGKIVRDPKEPPVITDDIIEEGEEEIESDDAEDVDVSDDEEADADGENADADVEAEVEEGGATEYDYTHMSKGLYYDDGYLTDGEEVGVGGSDVDDVESDGGDGDENDEIDGAFSD